MTPSASRRWTRSATAGEDSPTRRPSSASVRRASAWSSATIRRFVGSSAETPFRRWFTGTAEMIPAESHVLARFRQASCGTEMRPRPHVYFLVSAVFHYLGPAFAVLLFARVDVLGVAWLRIASAAAVFALWRRPWRLLGSRDVMAWGAVLALMNCCFYEAIDRLALGTVAAIEFLPVVALAAVGVRTQRNTVALSLAVAGVAMLANVHLAGDPLGVALAFANAILFALYIVLAARVAGDQGIDALGAAMLVAAIVVTPPAGWAAVPAF